MFETELANKFKKIFNLKKVSYDEPSGISEQECLFLEIQDCKSNFKDKRWLGTVRGNGLFFAQNDKIKFGFFSKQIANANKNDTKDLFFSEFEENTNRYLNLVQRSFSFVYFFDFQYDPSLGTITSIDITEV